MQQLVVAAALLAAAVAPAPLGHPARRHSFSYSSWINDLPSNSTPEGPLLGQGDLGAVLQSGNGTGAFDFFLGMNQMWGKHRWRWSNVTRADHNSCPGKDGTVEGCAWPRVVSFGGLRLGCAGFGGGPADVGFAAEQLIAEGVVTANYTKHDGAATVSVRAYLDPANKSFVVEVTSGREHVTVDADLWTRTLSPAPWMSPAPPGDPATAQAGCSSRGLGWVRRAAIPPSLGSGGAPNPLQMTAAAAMRVLGGNTAECTVPKPNVSDPSARIMARTSIDIPPGQTRVLLVSVRTSSDADVGSQHGEPGTQAHGHPDPVPTVLEEATAADISSVRAIEARNTVWWQGWWNHSSISLPTQPLLERTFFAINYVLGASTKPGRQAPDFYGPWTTSDNPIWYQYTLDYNFEAQQYGIFQSNHPEALQPYAEAVLEYARRSGVADATRTLQLFNRSCPAQADAPIHFPCGIAAGGLPVGGVGTVPVGDWGLRWCGMFASLPLISHWEYTRDAAFATNTTLPLLRGLAAFWRCWLTKSDDGTLEDLNDSMSEQAWWTGCNVPAPGQAATPPGAPGVGDGCTNWTRPMAPIAFLRRVLAALKTISHEAAGAPPAEPWWEPMLQALPPYPQADGMDCGWRGKNKSVYLFATDCHSENRKDCGNGMHLKPGQNALQRFTGLFAQYPIHPGETLSTATASAAEVERIRNTAFTNFNVDNSGASPQCRVLAYACALLTPQANPGSCYHRGKYTLKEQPVGCGERKEA